jgi:thymidylate synthase
MTTKNDRLLAEEQFLQCEVNRIAQLDHEAAMSEVASMAGSWLAEHGPGGDAISASCTLALAYRSRLAIVTTQPTLDPSPATPPENEAASRKRGRLQKTRPPPENEAGYLAPPENEAGYLALCRHILDHGERRTDRTGTGTLSVFGAQLWFDLRRGFPLLTTKRVPFASIVQELLWFLRGSTNVRDGLTQHTKIWDAWTDEDGDLGPIYGHQWRHWGANHAARKDYRRRRDEWSQLSLEERQRQEEQFLFPADASDLGGGPRGVDQITQAIETLKKNPDSRRIIVSAWNVADVPKMRLPPCHLLFQFNAQGGHLDCQLYQRSADMALGVPFNIASYALLTAMVARECGLVARHFVHTFGDAHIYLNHLDGVRLQLDRDPLPPPRLVLADRPVLAQTFEDVTLENYHSHPAIRFEVSI